MKISFSHHIAVGAATLKDFVARRSRSRRLFACSFARMGECSHATEEPNPLYSAGGWLAAGADVHFVRLAVCRRCLAQLAVSKRRPVPVRFGRVGNFKVSIR